MVTSYHFLLLYVGIYTLSFWVLPSANRALLDYIIDRKLRDIIFEAILWN